MTSNNQCVFGTILSITNDTKYEICSLARMASHLKDPLPTFLRAIERVYGSLPTSQPSIAASWVPPKSPGAGGHLGRYLWTDAFGVVDLLTLHQQTGSPVYLTLAGRLATTVHDVLGRTRDQRSRLPGASEAHPLAAGLRIGKKDEFGPDGDGQYHHYLTLWMFALERLARATGERRWLDLGLELAKGIHGNFVVHRPGPHGQEPARMVWKVSMDGKKVLVPSEGHLDAATGYVVYRLLQETWKEFEQRRLKVNEAHDGQAVETSPGEAASTPPLSKEIDEYRQLMHRSGKLTASRDSLDLGMALWMCHLVRDVEPWAVRLGEECISVARSMLADGASIWRRSAGHRLAFREFGLCLGVRCWGGDENEDLLTKVDKLLEFWHREMELARDEDLRAINLVMYAAALIPGGKFAALPAPWRFAFSQLT